jgi:hypothetical protein
MFIIMDRNSDHQTIQVGDAIDLRQRQS